MKMERIEIDRDEKPLLGRYIRLLRTTQYRSQHAQGWEIARFCMHICAPATLSRLENGQSVKNDDVYDQLLAKLGLRYNYQKDLRNLHQVHGQALLRQLNGEDSAHDLPTLAGAYRRALAPWRSYAVEGAVYDMLALFDEQSSTPAKQATLLREALALYPALRGGLREALAVQIFARTHNTAGNQIQQIAQILWKHPPCSANGMLAQANYLLQLRQYFAAAAALHTVFQRVSRENTPLLWMQTENLILDLIDRTHSTEWDAHLSAYADFVRRRVEAGCRDAVTLAGLHCAAVSFVAHRLYAQARTFLVLSIRLAPKTFLEDSYLLYVLSTLDGEPVPPEAKQRYDPSLYPDMAVRAHRFYELKEAGASFEALEAYIFNDLGAFLANVDDATFEDMGRELEACIAVTGHQKLRYRYRHLRDKVHAEQEEDLSGQDG